MSKDQAYRDDHGGIVVSPEILKEADAAGWDVDAFLQGSIRRKDDDSPRVRVIPSGKRLSLLRNGLPVRLSSGGYWKRKYPSIRL